MAHKINFQLQLRDFYCRVQFFLSVLNCECSFAVVARTKNPSFFIGLKIVIDFCAQDINIRANTLIFVIDSSIEAGIVRNGSRSEWRPVKTRSVKFCSLQKLEKRRVCAAKPSIMLAKEFYVSLYWLFYS